jgi:hypothetical protein
VRSRDDNERTFKIALLSSLLQMKFGGETCAVPSSGVMFSTADYDQEMGWLTEAVEPLRILSSERVQYDMLTYRLDFQGNTLADYLQSAPKIDDLDGDKVLLTFLRIASSYDPRRHTRGDPPLPSLPTTREAFALPAHFIPAVDALCLGGYCDRKGPMFQWTDEIAPFMEEAWLWIDGIPAAELRQRELLRRWDTMPPKVRAMVAAPEGSVDLRRLMVVWGHFWYDGAWHDKPGNEQSYQRNDLIGGSFNQTLDLAELLKDRANKQASGSRPSVAGSLRRFLSPLLRR